MMKKKMGFGTLGIAVGVLVVIVSIIWVAMINLGREDRGGNEVTWVG